VTVAGFPLNPWSEVRANVVATFTSIPTLAVSNTTPEPTALIEFPTGEVTSTLPPLPTQTPLVVPSLTPTGIGNIGSGEYVAMEGTPLYMPYPDGCGSMFVAGTVTDAEGASVTFMEVRLGGIFGVESAFSGTAEQYGESGWEIDLGQAPTNTTAQVFLELFDPDLEQPVSGKVLFSTFDDCNSNLIMINFVQE
jgi:hypothetical protein